MHKIHGRNKMLNIVTQIAQQMNEQPSPSSFGPGEFVDFVFVMVFMGLYVCN